MERRCFNLFIYIHTYIYALTIKSVNKILKFKIYICMYALALFFQVVKLST